MRPLARCSAAEEVLVGTGANEANGGWEWLIDQQPIVFDVALSEAKPLALQLMIPVGGSQRTRLEECVHYGAELPKILTPPPNALQVS